MTTDYKDISKVIKRSLETGSEKEKVLEEAFVAQPKHFDLPTQRISKKTKSAHVDLYENYLKKFNRISAELDTVSRDAANLNHSAFRNLKVDEAYNLNAAYLHELYFANISDIDSEITVDSLAYMRLARDFGSFDDWQRDFIACALSARNGWVVTVFNTYLQSYVNMVVDLHSQNLMVGAYPVIVVDVWEHAYYADRQNDRKAYIFAMLKELNWEVIENRFKRADRVAEALR